MSSRPTIMPLLVLLATASHAAAQSTTLVDLIGPDDGSAIIPGVLLQNQQDPQHPDWDTFVIESLSNPDALALSRLEAVIGGVGGWQGVDAISAMRIMVFDSVEDAQTGNPALMVLDETLMGPPATDSSWPLSSTSQRLLLDVGPWDLAAGDYWIAITPVNEFDTNGMANLAVTLEGDSQCWHVSPAGLGGWTLRDLPMDAAIAVIAGPCGHSLDPYCPADVTSDQWVTILDILKVLQHWGDVSDGTNRPVGDCAPLPYGDCFVGVDDLLQVVSAFGEDCRDRGACCIPDGSCIESLLEEACVAAGGEWLVHEACTSCQRGACCFPDTTCLDDLRAGDCTGAGGSFMGDSTLCSIVVCPNPQGACCIDADTCVGGLIDSDCLLLGGIHMGPGTVCGANTCIAANNNCAQAAVAQLGANPFDSTQASDSGFGAPDESMCPDTFLNWNDSRDVWFKWTADTDALLNITTCDTASFDTSIVIYRGVDCGSLEQIACNGDGAGLSPCQPYYSRVTDLLVETGDKIWIRIGGYEGAGGPGTRTLEVSDPLESWGCCVDATCAGDMSAVACAKLGGIWTIGLPCSLVDCGAPAAPCSSGLGDDPVHPDLDWAAGTSDATSGWMRAESINATTISTIRVQGLAMQFGGGWSSCSDPALMTFNVRAWADDGDGQPGTLQLEQLELPPSQCQFSAAYPTAIGWFSMYAWDLDLPENSGDYRWISVQSNSSTDAPCIFLWMSSTEEGAGTSLVNDGSGWSLEQYGLNYCAWD
ncbi:MAG: hypothetical protein MK101_07900 [Phycisphaerales bacterium]|nr:hypothetical protein [Phycisphaerales bacterium]